MTPVDPATEPRSETRWVEQIVQRLSTEFCCEMNHVRAIVQASRHDLNGVPLGALPELAERLAHQRLLEAPSPHPMLRTLAVGLDSHRDQPPGGV